MDTIYINTWYPFDAGIFYVAPSGRLLVRLSNSLFEVNGDASLGTIRLTCIIDSTLDNFSGKF